MAKIGDVYESRRSSIPYILQLVARDLTQLNSDVVAIWKIGEDVDVENLKNIKPYIFVHTTVLAGERLGFWKRIGKIAPVDYDKVRFKQPDIDYLADEIEDEQKCGRWHTWQINGEWKTISKNLFDDNSIFQGGVEPPFAVNYFIEHGRWTVSEDYADSLKPGVDY